MNNEQAPGQFFELPGDDDWEWEYGQGDLPPLPRFWSAETALTHSSNDDGGADETHPPNIGTRWTAIDVEV